MLRTPGLVLGHLAPVVLSIAAGLPSVSCGFADGILTVDDPDIVDRESLDDLQGGTAVYHGALGEFALAKDGGLPVGLEQRIGIVQAGGWFSDEFAFGGEPPELRAMDQRNVEPRFAAWEQTYRNLHRTRALAAQAAELLQKELEDPGADARVGELYAISGLVHILLGEHYCSGIPFSTGMPEIRFGEPLTTDEVMERALDRLDRGAAFTAGDERVANLLRVAQGRALLNLGRFDEAANAVSEVPTTFVYHTLHSTASDRQVNFMFVENFEQDRYSVSDREGGEGLDFATAGDPRVPTEFVGLSRFDGETPMYRYLKLGGRDAPVETASGIEARMIEAEALLRAGEVGAWLQTLNAARTTIGMDSLADPGAAEAQVDLMFRERAFWLFNTGHRLGDLRRLLKQYGRRKEEIYPWGAYHKDNLTRGQDLAIVIPASENNNPRYTPCNDEQP